jgi:hypothetical protein
MLGQKVLPTILLLLPATFALTVHPTVVEAASNECKAKPDSAAPAGTRWYYRANRVDHSRCWFLSSSNVSAHSRLRQSASVTRGHFITPDAGEVPDAQQNPQVNPQIASAIEPAADGLLSGQTMVPQLTTRAQDPPRSYELLARKVATIPYRLAVASAQPPSGALVQASPSGSQASAGVANFNLLFLGAAIATSLSLAGGVFNLTRRVRSRDHALADQPNANRRIIAYAPEPVAESLEKAKQQLCSIGQPSKRQPSGRQPSERQPARLTADDLNRSLRELRRNLQRAGFARAA